MGRSTRGLDDHHGVYPTDVPAIQVHEDPFNMDHQGFIGFIQPREGSMHDIEKSARRLAAELVLLPAEQRGGAYDDEYLKDTSMCHLWKRIRCAYCDCHKRGGL